MIIDNVPENFALQPKNGIGIYPWYDDPNDMALFNLSPMLEELCRTGCTVEAILQKYEDQIPSWAGHVSGQGEERRRGEYDIIVSLLANNDTTISELRVLILRRFHLYKIRR